jgi:hypothetical protein
MAKYVTDEALRFRKLVVDLDGCRDLIAQAEGVSPSAISHRLNSQLHGAWWRAYKKARAKRRLAARRRRSRQNCAARATARWAISRI